MNREWVGDQYQVRVASHCKDIPKTVSCGMKKWLLRIGIGVVALVIVALIGAWAYVRTNGPKYSGEINLPGLQANVEVFHDEFGVPHIYAQNEEDAHYALGYLHAQERLFQMEMVRRVASGRLSELLGQQTAKIDAYFRTLGIAQQAHLNAEYVFSQPQQQYHKDALAYLRGINHFLETGKTPVEFRLLGIPKEKFTPDQFYLAAGFMSLGFAEGFRHDPYLSAIRDKYGDTYLRDWAVGLGAFDQTIKSHKGGGKAAITGKKHAQAAPSLLPFDATAPNAITAFIASHIFPMMHGSNSWVVAGSKSASGKVLFANDAHIGYGQPCTWWEAHIECPTLSIYGNYLAGVPLPVIAHTRHHAWGMTMFENDDVNFYRETINPENPNQVMYKGTWTNLTTRQEVIHVKGQQDTIVQVRVSPHGPIINTVLEPLKSNSADTRPVAVWWTFLQEPSDLLMPLYGLAKAGNLADVRTACSALTSPGVNLMYGDADGNVGWFACAKLPKFAPGTNTFFLLNGANGKDDPIGWYDFVDNPSSENPPSGYVYSANNQPDTVKGVLFPGYYYPESRSRRITDALDDAKNWTPDDMKHLITDAVGPPFPKIAAEVQRSLMARNPPTDATQKAILQTLATWNGDHQTTDIAPTMYYKLVWHVLHGALYDELGEEAFKELISHAMMQRTLPVLMANDSSKWWDNVATPARETRRDIFAAALAASATELTDQLGSDPAQWTWGKVHTIEFVHPIGRQKPLDKLFNVGPSPVMGGKEVVNNVGFDFTGDGLYPALYGPSKRIVIDFADVENAVSVLPTGQSGHALSPHYSDQTPLYIAGKFRKMKMNRAEIEHTQTGKMTFKP